ncbi:MAG: hypothetical protein CMJ64_00965 [Planctomycetaceae bacterium]|nr:hypothetical protein [Planctomycetaceae bacterium]
MNESKIEATDRLRREGRWSEASRYKDASVKRLRAAGKTKAEANDIAWADMLAAFPPLAQDPLPIPREALDTSTCDPATIDELAAEPLDWERDIQWVYAHLEHPTLRVENAPSLGAWGLLRHARQDRSRFFAQCGAVLARSLKALPTRRPEDEGPEDDPYASDPGLRDLERMIAQFSDTRNSDCDANVGYAREG